MTTPSDQSNEPFLLSIKNACCILGIGRTKLYELIGSEEIATVFIGTRRLVVVESLHAYLKRLKDKGPSKPWANKPNAPKKQRRRRPKDR